MKGKIREKCAKSLSFIRCEGKVRDETMFAVVGCETS